MTLQLNASARLARRPLRRGFLVYLRVGWERSRSRLSKRKFHRGESKSRHGCIRWKKWISLKSERSVSGCSGICHFRVRPVVSTQQCITFPRSLPKPPNCCGIVPHEQTFSFPFAQTVTPYCKDKRVPFPVICTPNHSKTPWAIRPI